MAHKKIKQLKGTNPTLLSLMQAGCKVLFPSGYYMVGLPYSKNSIEVGHEFGSEGLWNLDKEGVVNALLDAKKYEKDEDPD